ncbi:MAG: hypothetical protein PHF00_01230 [Elusimicrobia bacterium]|nr:hypothetical protein [Elusimicrobiota bacterium]
MRRLIRSRAGQVVIPALFLFPTFMLFVYLIYETAKLSREKIRHQFAVDAAVFVEMTNYSDFLNRTAYVNGAFPMRIFDEGFRSTMIDCDGKAGCHGQTSLWEIMCKNGDFPMPGGTCDLGSKKQYYNSEEDAKWDIRFYESKWGQKNDSPPTSVEGTLSILTMDDANAYWINWDDANQVYKLYVQIYQLLGSVEDAQLSVLTRLAAQHNFLKKSYWLNTGDPIDEAAAAAGIFGKEMDDSNWKSGSGLKYFCYEKMNFYGNKPTHSMFQPWQVYAPDPPPTMESKISGCDGLFHLMWVSPALTNNIKKSLGSSMFPSRGVPVTQSWTAPSNYFNYDFNRPSRPAVHVTVAIDGFGGAKAAVWPDPTPKFQVRTYP